MANTKKYISLDKLGKYHVELVKLVDAKDAAILGQAKGYADSLATNYDAAGSAASAQAAVQANLDAEIARAKAAEEAALKAGQDAQKDVDALELVVDEIQRNAYDDTELRGLITGLTNDKADKTQVATDIAEAVKVEKEAREAAVKGVQDAVDTLSGTHATDKKALEDAIALKADQTALDAVSDVADAAATKVALGEEVTRATGEEARIEGLVTAEAERAVAVEEDFEERIAKMEVFWETTEDSDGIVNKLKEIQDYITSDETGAATMAGNIQANTQAIEAMDTAYKAADTTLQGNIDTLSGVVDTKAAQSDLEALDGRVEVVEGAVATKVEQSVYTEKVAALEGADSALSGRIATLEGKFGGAEGSVEDQIADAKQEAIDAAADDATTKANAAEANAKGHADGLNTAMNTRVEALEAIDHTHANAEELDKIVVGDKAKWDEAYQKAHEHGNKAVLDGITAEQVTAWDKVSGKAEQTALQAEIDRAMAAEKANADAIALFVEASEEEVLALFNA